MYYVSKEQISRTDYKNMQPTHVIHEVSVKNYLEKHSNYKCFSQTETQPLP